MKKLSFVLVVVFLALTNLNAQHRKIDTIMKLGNVGFKLVCNNKNDDKNGNCDFSAKILFMTNCVANTINGVLQASFKSYCFFYHIFLFYQFTCN